MFNTLNKFFENFLIDNEEMCDNWKSDENQANFKKLVNSLYKKKEKKEKKKEEESDGGVEKPKKAKTAYIYFCTAERENIRNKFPELSATEITKKLGELWKSIRDDEEKIHIFKDLENKDKERYNNEMTDKVKTKKVKKVQEGPKKNTSAYIKFCKDEREKVKEELPTLSCKDIIKELGARWKALETNDPERKEYYNQLFIQDKAKYEAEYKAWKEGKANEVVDEKLPVEEDEPVEKKVEEKKPRGKGKAKKSEEPVVEEKKVEEKPKKTTKAKVSKKVEEPVVEEEILVEEEDAPPVVQEKPKRVRKPKA